MAATFLVTVVFKRTVRAPVHTARHRLTRPQPINGEAEPKEEITEHTFEDPARCDLSTVPAIVTTLHALGQTVNDLEYWCVDQGCWMPYADEFRPSVTVMVNIILVRVRLALWPTFGKHLQTLEVWGALPAYQSMMNMMREHRTIIDRPQRPNHITIVLYDKVSMPAVSSLSCLTCDQDAARPKVLTCVALNEQGEIDLTSIPALHEAITAGTCHYYDVWDVDEADWITRFHSRPIRVPAGYSTMIARMDRAYELLFLGHELDALTTQIEHHRIAANGQERLDRELDDFQNAWAQAMSDENGTQVVDLEALEALLARM